MTENIGELLAEVLRADVVESQHLGHLVALNADGSVGFTRGNPNLKIFPRSAIKSIQASAMVRHGLKLEPRLLSLVAASHSGGAIHQEGVLEILRGAGLHESDLQNVEGRPIGEKESWAWGEKPSTRLAMNCSGKHAGMLATCVAKGWDTATYLDPKHPVQIACKEEFENLAQEKIEAITKDGCGAPLFLMSVTGIARAIHSLTVSTDPVHQIVINSCRAHPIMMSGEGRASFTLMTKYPGLFMKEGAEAVNVASLPDGKTVVFKIMDGSSRAFNVVTTAAFEKLGADITRIEEPVLGGGQRVGSIRAAF